MDMKTKVLFSYKHVKKYLVGRTLDIGCHYGNYLKDLPDGSIGIDNDDDSIIYCAGKGYNIKRHNANNKLPFRNGEFDGILCSHIMEHLEKPIYMLKEAIRVLRPNGMFILGLPVEYDDTYFSEHNHLTSYTINNARILLERYGMEVVDVCCQVGGLSRLFKLSESWEPIATAYWIVARKRLC